MVRYLRTDITGTDVFTGKQELGEPNSGQQD